MNFKKCARKKGEKILRLEDTFIVIEERAYYVYDLRRPGDISIECSVPRTMCSIRLVLSISWHKLNT